MKIAIVTTTYIDSFACCINDGLITLGHEVYNLQGPAINYAESWPVPSPAIDLLFMMDTNNELGLMIPTEKMGEPLRGATKVSFHLHDRFTDYVNAPNSPIKEVPVNKINTQTVFVRDLDMLTEQRFKDKGIKAFPLDYAIERRYVESCGDQSKVSNRSLGMVFYGTLTTAHRQEILEATSKVVSVKYGAYEFNTADTKWSRWIYGRYTHDPNYYEELCKYMFCFVPLGAGVSTMRLGECYAAGCIPVIQRYPSDIIPYYNFVDEENCLLWETKEELISKLEKWMKYFDDAEELRQKCYKYGEENMLSSHLAQYILKNIE